MPHSAQAAAETYIRASAAQDPAVRMQLLEDCFAENGRLVTRGRVLQGRAAIAAMLAAFHDDPRALGFSLTSVVDAGDTIFRYRSVVELRDGKTTEFFDAGEIDAEGRISTLLVFSGPLADV